MYKLMLCLATALILSACASHTPAPSQQRTLSQALQQNGGKTGVQNGPNGSELICSNTPNLGSHLSHVRCLTPAQEAARQKADQKAVQQMQQRSQLCAHPPACLKPSKQ